MLLVLQQAIDQGLYLSIALTEEQAWLACILRDVFWHSVMSLQAAVALFSAVDRANSRLFSKIYSCWTLDSRLAASYHG